MSTSEVFERADELRARSTEWLRARRAELVVVQRRARAEELAIVAILDERGALERGAVSGISGRVERDTLETARRLEALPAIAQAAADGRISDEQLVQVAQLADEHSDAEWAERIEHCSPAQLERMVREQRTATAEEALARHRARSLRLSWNRDRTVLRINGELPDLLGVKVEATINDLIDHTRPPAKGQPWEARDRRAADALGQLCDHHTNSNRDDNRDGSGAGERGGRCERAPTRAVQPVMVVEVPQHGTPTINGVPLPVEIVEQLRANATIEPVLVDDHGVPLAIGRRDSPISPKKARSVLLRDGGCVCGCGLRHGLELHHMVPRSWGGSDDISNLVSVFAAHHRELIPHGPYAIVGNPNIPGGLRRVRYADLSTQEAARYGLPPPPGSRRPRRE